MPCGLEVEPEQSSSYLKNFNEFFSVRRRCIEHGTLFDGQSKIVRWCERQSDPGSTNTQCFGNFTKKMYSLFMSYDSSKSFKKNYNFPVKY